jgi:hypothetical protein
MDVDEFESFQSADFESNPMSDDKKHNQAAKMNDPISDMILRWYRQIETKEMAAVKFGALAAVPGSILFFCIFISSSTANLIAFTAFAISVGFIMFSIWMLGSILDNDPGTKAMQDVADPIREGSEGFFMT